jgi:hypothetical protein
LHANALTLAVLTKPQHLTVVLRHHGWSDEQILRALEQERTPPGDLLLGLFNDGAKEKDLVASLGPEATRELENGTLKSGCLALLGLITIVVCAVPGWMLEDSADLRAWVSKAGFVTLMALVAPVGALGGVLFGVGMARIARDPTRWWAFGLFGAIGAPGGLAAST